jgi:threonine dehydratase
MIPTIEPVCLEAVRSAAERCRGITIRTPLVTCGVPSTSGAEVHLKLESLQPIGAFKARPVCNIVLSRTSKILADGLYTASSGNSALAVAWMAKRLGLTASALVPHGAPEAKLGPIRALGGHIEMLTFDQWWEVITNAGRRSQRGYYIDAVRDPAALAGNGTIGLEVSEQLADCDAVFAPFGGGGLLCGIGCAIKALRPDIRIVGCELTSAAPLGAAFEAGRPIKVPSEVGFISGVGVGSVLPEMWPLLSKIVDEVVTVSLAEVTRTIGRVAIANHVILEGAGAIPVAAALSGRHLYRKVCAIVSGGNLDPSVLVDVLQGRIA